MYPIDFNFDDKGQYSYKLLSEIDQQFTVLNKDDIPEVLQRCEAYTGKETLGVFLTPDGNNNHAKKALETKAKQWRDNLRAGHLNPSLA